MGPDLVVLSKPLINHVLGLKGCTEPFSIKDFTAQRSVEAFVISVLPRCSGVDPDRLGPDFG